MRGKKRLQPGAEPEMSDEQKDESPKKIRSEKQEVCNPEYRLRVHLKCKTQIAHGYSLPLPSSKNKI